MNDDGNDELGLRPHVPSLKLIVPTFAERVNPEAYLDWERRMDHIFASYAAAQLKDHAFTWWDLDMAEKRRNRERPVQTLDIMKFMMRR